MVLASAGAMRERQALLAFTAIALGAGAFVQLRSSAAERAHRIRGGFIDVNGARVPYLERGSGDALVLLHGLGSVIGDLLLSGPLSRARREYPGLPLHPPGHRPPGP